MKFCPTCETRYDEEILRFCMKDGTPLVEEGVPNFTEMPSESIEDDPSEVTIIRRKGEIPIPPPVMDEAGEFEPPDPEPLPQEPVFRPKEVEAPRIVVPMEQPHAFQPRVIPQPQYQQPQRSNTILVAILTAFGTVTLVVIGAGILWFFMRDTDASSNVNTNPPNLNVNLNTNLGYDPNFNFNASGNFNSANVNTNSNTKTPTPTPKPSPTPTPTPTPDEDETPTPTPRPSPSVPTMTSTPRPSPTVPRMAPVNRPVSNRPFNGN